MRTSALRVVLASPFDLGCLVGHLEVGERNLLDLAEDRLSRLTGQLLDQRQAVHGVFGVGADSAVLGRDALVGEAPRERRAADDEVAVDARLLEVARSRHHLLRALDQKSGEPHDVGLVLAHRLDELLTRHLDAEVDDFVAVVRE